MTIQELAQEIIDRLYPKKRWSDNVRKPELKILVEKIKKVTYEKNN